jgi:hypothetical protein
MIETELKVKLNYPTENIREADIFVIDNGEYYKAEIYMAGTYVEYQEVRKGDEWIDCYYPFEGHDKYRGIETLSNLLDPIASSADWIRWLKKHVASQDPYDVFKNLRDEGLIDIDIDIKARWGFRPIILAEISDETKKAVLEKWKKALDTGWRDEYWISCEMCADVRKLMKKFEMGEARNRCQFCPCYEPGFCRNGRQESKLCIDSCNSAEEWESNVREFLAWLETP